MMSVMATKKKRPALRVVASNPAEAVAYEVARSRWEGWASHGVADDTLEETAAEVVVLFESICATLPRLRRERDEAEQRWLSAKEGADLVLEGLRRGLEIPDKAFSLLTLNVEAISSFAKKRDEFERWAGFVRRAAASFAHPPVRQSDGDRASLVVRLIESGALDVETSAAFARSTLFVTTTIAKTWPEMAERLTAAKTMEAIETAIRVVARGPGRRSAEERNLPSATEAKNRLFVCLGLNVTKESLKKGRQRAKKKASRSKGLPPTNRGTSVRPV